MKKYVLNFNWLFLEKIVRIGGGIFVGIWVARYLGPQDFGVINYSLAFIAFFSWMSHLGLQQILVRELTKYPEKTEQLLTNALVMKFIGAIVAILAITISIVFVKPSVSIIQLAVTILSLVYVFQAFDVIDCFYQARVMSKYVATVRVVAFTIVLALKVLMIVLKLPLIYFVIAGVVEAFMVSIGYVYLYIRHSRFIRLSHIDIPVMAELMRYSWPLMLSSFLISIHMKVDQVMIGNMLNIGEVGIYSVAVRLSEGWYFIPSLVISTVMPYFISLKECDEDLYRLRLRQLLSFMFWLGVSVGVLTLLYGQGIVVTLFGEEYSSAYTALIYNIWGGIFISQGMAAGIWMIAENQQLQRLYIQLIAVVANVCMNWVFIPMWGIEGAAIATVVTLCMTNWGGFFLFRRLREIGLLILKSTSPWSLFLFVREWIVMR